MGAKCAVEKKSAIPKAFFDIGSVDKDLGVYNTKEKNGRAYIFNHYKFKIKSSQIKVSNSTFCWVNFGINEFI